ncbi:MAG: DUF6320 domain-containing protein [Clostridiales bacterium]
MAKCKNCGVSLLHNQCCPLCGREVNKAEECETVFPSYEKIYAKMSKVYITQVFFVLMFAAICLSATINYLSWERYQMAWSLLVTGTLVYVWFTVRRTIMLNARVGGKIIFQFLVLSCFLFILDFFTGFHKWSTTYAIPFLAIASTFGLNMVALKKKEQWFDYLGYFLVMFLMSCLPILFYPFGLSNRIWTGIIAIGYSVITIIVMILVADKTFFDEMKKRFHF